jgi:hypothetical protein
MTMPHHPGSAASQGEGRIFSHCEGFDPDTGLRQWRKDRGKVPAASYVNWRGRTVR